MLQPVVASRLALGVVVLAGYADAVSFVQFREVYASFMSGNTTALGAALAEGHWHRLGLLAGVVVLFVVGVGLGTGLHRAGRYPAARVLLAIAGLLGVAGATPLGLWALVLSMGMLNAAVHQSGSTTLSLTYVTGTLVKVGVGLADWLGGRGLPAGWAWQALSWLGLAAGAVAGAGTQAALGQRALLPAAGAALLLALVARRAARA